MLLKVLTSIIKSYNGEKWFSEAERIAYSINDGKHTFYCVVPIFICSSQKYENMKLSILQKSAKPLEILTKLDQGGGVLN